MEPVTLLVLGGAGYYLYEKKKNPSWSPLRWLFSSPLEKHAALESVKTTSVPTPGPAVALDPGMTSDQVHQVNDALMTETDAVKITALAKALSDLGFASSASALAAKAASIQEAKALGASETDIAKQQIQASATPAVASPRVGWGSWGEGWGGWEPAWRYHSELAHEAYENAAHLDAMSHWVGAARRRVAEPRGRVAESGFGRQPGFGGRRRYVAPEHHFGHRRHYVPWPEPEPEPLPEPEPEFIPVPEHHHHHHEPPPEPIIHGYVTSGLDDGAVFAGVIPYSGGGLVAEYPSGPQTGQVPWAEYPQQQYYPREDWYGGGWGGGWGGGYGYGHPWHHHHHRWGW
jgi:hypothetical protein